jgi:hypothetical protein
MLTSLLLGSKYFISFIDDFSRRTSIFFLKVKFETLNVFKIDKKEVKNQIGQKIKVFIFVQGGKFTLKAAVRFCEEQGLRRDLIIARRPKLNAISKCKKNIMEKARNMHIDSGTPKSF